MAAPSAYPHPAYSTVAYPQTAYPQTPFPQTTFPQTAYPQTAYPQTANPQPVFLQPVNPQVANAQVASAGATVTPLYTPVTLFNWWRPRTVAGYMVTPNASTVVARPAYTAVAPANMAGSAGPAGPAMVAPVAVPVAPAPVTAYYQPSYHPGGIVVATPPAPTAMAPITVHPPAYGDATVVAPAPVVYARPVVGPRQAYLYSRGPLGFPRLDPVPPGTVVQPAAVPFIPAILP
jgi:hypothetical protein